MLVALREKHAVPEGLVAIGFPQCDFSPCRCAQNRFAKNRFPQNIFSKLVEAKHFLRWQKLVKPYGFWMDGRKDGRMDGWKE